VRLEDRRAEKTDDIISARSGARLCERPGQRADRLPLFRISTFGAAGSSDADGRDSRAHGVRDGSELDSGAARGAAGSGPALRVD